ncbi:MAG: type III-B CRISPR module RAMP protein Cmr6 [Brevinematia bacterium]
MSVLYPIGIDIKDIINNNFNGNFGLWYNKFVPVNDINYKASDNQGNSNNAVNYYKDKFASLRVSLPGLLKQKHLSQIEFYKSFPSDQYEVIVIQAKTKSPLITGIGQPHPHEISMVFDYNLGIPYIPASSIKGVVRFATMLNLLNSGKIKNDKSMIKKDKKGNFYIEDDKIEEIAYYFGTQKEMGGVIFLDAYPLSVPELHIDIINPHYKDYYENDKPPADYLEPNPIKFLTVKPGTTFVFRTIVRKNKIYRNEKKERIEKKECDLTLKVKDTLVKALTEEGIGAKTSLGYGLFNEVKYEEDKNLEEEYKKLLKERERIEKEKIQRQKEEEEKRKLESMSEIERDIYNLSKLNSSPQDEQKVFEIYNKLDKIESIEDKKKIANALMEYFKLCKKWDEKSVSNKQKEKVKKIKNILGIG